MVTAIVFIKADVARIPEVAELRMEAFLPADEQTAEALRVMDPAHPV